MTHEPTDREFTNPHFPPQGNGSRSARRAGGRPLRVLKFGGTSVGDASCIRKMVAIVADSSLSGHVVVVVSAMGGVTNQLIEAATHAAAGDRRQAATILDELRQQHERAARALIHSGGENKGERDRVHGNLKQLFVQCEGWCETTARQGELTPQMRDLISSLGERLSAPLVAAALAAQGLPCEAIEATELVVTDANHGCADPQMDLTSARCRARLVPLLHAGVLPVVTGFIGATEAGALTTLGRGGSDYSASILGAALGADEVVIWTDVDGMLTADPRLVPDAATIPEISYREAAELAHFGAKVLHPKTLRPVMQCGIPVWIRNTFAPEKSGTKITSRGRAGQSDVKALTAVRDAALITVIGAAGNAHVDLLNRAMAAAAAVRTDVLMVTHSPSRDRVSLVVASSSAAPTAEALRREFGSGSGAADRVSVSVDATVALLTVVGENLQVVQGVVARALDELGRTGVTILAAEPGASRHNVSFVVPRKHLDAALRTTHREFQPEMVSLPQTIGSEAQLL